MDVNGCKNNKGGNTERSPLLTRWCFTLNNWNMDELDVLMDVFKNDIYYIGKEEGDEGTEHLQGCVKLKKQKRLSTLKKINRRIHWEGCKGTWDQNVTYCTKDNNYETNDVLLDII